MKKRLVTALSVLLIAMLLVPIASAATLTFVMDPEEDGWWNSSFPDDERGSNGNSWRMENDYLVNDIYGGAIRSPHISVDTTKPYSLSVKIEVGDVNNGFVFLSTSGANSKPYENNVFSVWLKFNQANFVENEWYMTNLYTPAFPSGVVAGENRGVSNTGGNPPRVVVCALEYDGNEFWFRMYDQTGKGTPILSERIEKNAPYTEGHPWGEFTDVDNIFVWAEGSFRPVKILDYSFVNVSSGGGAAGGSASTADSYWLFIALVVASLSGIAIVFLRKPYASERIV